jgi:hypothetical protein
MVYIAAYFEGMDRCDSMRLPLGKLRVASRTCGAVAYASATLFSGWFPWARAGTVDAPFIGTGHVPDFSTQRR